MKVIPVRLPDKIVEIIDKLVQEGFYANRSAAVRVIITNYALKETQKIRKDYSDLVHAEANDRLADKGAQ
jgi:Arc/MetJ-type ribon-helix-helix transcriptional regulator